LIRAAGRIPAERYTTYGIRQVFEEEPAELAPLDSVQNSEERSARISGSS